MNNQKKYESIFSYDEDWQYNACINSYHDSINLYADGYKEAAKRLSYQVLEGTGTVDTLVYPIVFLYRQYIELKLKKIILEGKALLDQKSEFPPIHKFSDLWKMAKPLIEKIYKDEPDKEPLQLLDHVIQEFIKIDDKSIAFRYPIEKNGITPNLPNVKYINIKRLSGYMEAASELLDGISGGISDYLDNKNEMLRE